MARIPDTEIERLKSEVSGKAGADIRTRLQRIGLYRDSGHEYFNGSLVVPVFDEAGNVVEVYGRKLLNNLRPGTPKHLYLPAREGRTRGVFNVAALGTTRSSRPDPAGRHTGARTPRAPGRGRGSSTSTRPPVTTGPTSTSSPSR